MKKNALQGCSKNVEKVYVTMTETGIGIRDETNGAFASKYDGYVENKFD